MASQPHGKEMMGRLALILIAALLGLAAAGAVMVGLFPPEPRQAPVERVLPAERFGTR
ncbi:hypothetical protein [Elioraea sp.]|uniref:hypothetical protein n=1 Tax=Elioraea sp. TaxID=2185103 RepID=UPI0025B9A867|nr:hypothetical protein [Elioraea sp.]